MSLGARCPICDDPGPFVLWVGPTPPDRCPEDYECDGPPRVRSVTDCRYQRTKAGQMARRRRLAPHCFDQNGKIIKGMAGEALEAFARAYPDEPLAI